MAYPNVIPNTRTIDRDCPASPGRSREGEPKSNTAWTTTRNRFRWPRRSPPSADGLPRRHPRPLRADQAVGRHPHRRTAADVDGRVDRGGPQGKPHRLRRHQEAGPDLPDPQGAGQAQRADVRRGDAGGPARRLRLPPQPRLSLPLLPRRHLRLAQPDSPLRPEDGHDRLRPDPPAQGERALLRPAAGRGDQLPGPEPAGQQGLLRRADAAASRRADPHGDHARRDRACGWST